MADNILDLEGG